MLFTGNVFRFYQEKKFLLQEMVVGGAGVLPAHPLPFSTALSIGE